MTDYDKLKNLLEEFGVGFWENPENHETGQDYISISTETGRKRVDGYSGFQSEFQFDKDGKFIKIAIWE